MTGYFLHAFPNAVAFTYLPTENAEESKSLTTEHTEHTEYFHNAFFRVFGVFRGKSP
jgi:hypothetical protein